MPSDKLQQMKDKLFNFGSGLVQKAVGIFQQPPPPPPSFQDALRLKIEGCNYDKLKKPLILQAAMQLHNEFQFDCGILTFTENNHQASYLQLSGHLKTSYKGTTYSVLTKIFFQRNFPQVNPLIRIINPDPSKFMVVQEYRALQSPSDHNSYILSNLRVLANWTPQSEVSAIVRQTLHMLAYVFPFRAKPTNTTPVINVQPNFVKPPPVIPPSGSNKVRQSVMNMTHNTSKMKQQMARQTDNLHKSYQATHSNIQKLDITNKCIGEQIGQIKPCLNDLSHFVSLPTEQVDLAACVTTVDQKSHDLLQIIVTKKALQQVITQLQSKFQAQELHLQLFLKLMRKYEEERFETWKILKNIASS